MRTLTALAGTAAALTCAAPAHAGIIGEAELGAVTERLVVAPAGGAWVSLYDGERMAIGRVGLDGSFRTTAIEDSPVDGVLGPDGKAWYRVAAAGFLRADGNDVVDRVTVAGDTLLGGRTALGTDGTVWTSAFDYDGIWHVAADATATKVPFAVPKGCRSDFGDAAAASDGALWLADWRCDRGPRRSRTSPSRRTAAHGSPVCTAG
jgi:hypothetical protein